MELDREQIIKALECCTSESEFCTGCPFLEVGACKQSSLLKLALSLIKELTVDLEAMRGAANSYKMHNDKLTEENERLRTRYVSADNLIIAETARMMQERLAIYFGTYTDTTTVKVGDVFRLIDKISKDILEGIK